jgi:mannose-6-phosphate isomerase class I
MQCIDFNDVEPGLLISKGEPLVRHESFAIDKWDLGQDREIAESGRFTIVVCLTGKIECAGRQFKPADFFLVPAQQPDRSIRPLEAETSLLRVTLPTA